MRYLTESISFFSLCFLLCLHFAVQNNPLTVLFIYYVLLSNLSKFTNTSNKKTTTRMTILFLSFFLSWICLFWGDELEQAQTKLEAWDGKPLPSVWVQSEWSLSRRVWVLSTLPSPLHSHSPLPTASSTAPSPSILRLRLGSRDRQLGIPSTSTLSAVSWLTSCILTQRIDSSLSPSPSPSPSPSLSWWRETVWVCPSQMSLRCGREPTWVATCKWKVVQVCNLQLTWLISQTSTHSTQMPFSFELSHSIRHQSSFGHKLGQICRTILERFNGSPRTFIMRPHPKLPFRVFYFEFFILVS